MRYFICSNGHTHWGPYGAAGLFILYRGEAGPQVLVTKRSREVMQPGTWSIPGGAIDEGETSLEAATREVAEELGELPPLSYVGTLTDDKCSDWAYYTVIVETPETFEIRPEHLNWETDEVRWVPLSELHNLPLHPGFAGKLEEICLVVEDTEVNS